jgi:hypothetical protein
VRLDRVVSVANLILAWRRLTTATNHQHKRWFRQYYDAFEAGHAENIRRLNAKLQGGWLPTPPIRIYLPTASGLQRPIGFLPIEDQIVLQAIANRAALRVAKRRKALEGKFVFSNLLTTPARSIFFLEDWRATFPRFQRACLRHFTAGNTWVANFDLSAFYDTISHRLLLASIGGKSLDDMTVQVLTSWFARWSTTASEHPYNHGIPQGPLASDFLSECVLLPIDELLSSGNACYVRYVDDIRIFARSKDDALAAAVALDTKCRALGLIPNSRKFEITRARNAREAVRGIFSFAQPGARDDIGAPLLPQRRAERMFSRALGRKAADGIDRTKLRHALYRGPRSRIIMNGALKLLLTQPEHIDPLMAYLQRCHGSRKVTRIAIQVLTGHQPYSYVRNEVWRLLAMIARAQDLLPLVPMALADLRSRLEPPAPRFGALVFLLRCEREGLGRFAGRIHSQSALVRTWLMRHTPVTTLGRHNFIRRVLLSPDSGPALMLARRFVRQRRSHRDYGVRVRQLQPEVQNAFRAVALIQRTSVKAVDQVGVILARRFGARRSAGWRRVLGSDYLHALQLLAQSDIWYDESRTNWCTFHDSFADALVRSILRGLRAMGHPGAMADRDANGNAILYGNLIAVHSPFGRTFPKIADELRLFHTYRSKLPAAHAYQRIGFVPTRFLTRPEQKALHRALAKAYFEVGALLPTL